MKADVVIAFYKHERYWPLVLSGLRDNAENIGRVFVVNDERWRETPDDGGLDIEFLDHDHDGFGLCKSLNQGIKASSAEFVLITEGDEFLEPGSLSETLALARSRVIVCARKRYVNDSGTVIEEDHRTDELFDVLSDGTLQWAACSGGHLLVDRAEAESIGFDEAYGYGLHDFDFAVRWIEKHGFGSIVFGGGYIRHIGSGRGRDLPSRESAEKFSRVLSRIYEGRYKINPESCSAHYINVCFHCGMNPFDLNWIEDGSAILISDDLKFGLFYGDGMSRHLKSAYTALRSGGCLSISNPGDREKIGRELSSIGFEFDNGESPIMAYKP